MKTKTLSALIDETGGLLLPDSLPIILPDKHREVFITRSIPVAGPDGEVFRGLYVFATEEWGKFVQWIETNHSISQTERASLQRYFVAPAVVCQVTGEGFVVIPKLLRQYASLHGYTVVIEEAGRYVLWRRETWQVVKYKMQENKPEQ